MISSRAHIDGARGESGQIGRPNGRTTAANLPASSHHLSMHTTRPAHSQSKATSHVDYPPRLFPTKFNFRLQTEFCSSIDADPSAGCADRSMAARRCKSFALTTFSLLFDLIPEEVLNSQPAFKKLPFYMPSSRAVLCFPGLAVQEDSNLAWPSSHLPSLPVTVTTPGLQQALLQLVRDSEWRQISCQYGR